MTTNTTKDNDKEGEATRNQPDKGQDKRNRLNRSALCRRSVINSFHPLAVHVLGDAKRRGRPDNVRRPFVHRSHDLATNALTTQATGHL